MDAKALQVYLLTVESGVEFLIEDTTGGEEITELLEGHARRIIEMAAGLRGWVKMRPEEGGDELNEQNQLGDGIEDVATAEVIMEDVGDVIQDSGGVDEAVAEKVTERGATARDEVMQEGKRKGKHRRENKENEVIFSQRHAEEQLRAEQAEQRHRRLIARRTNDTGAYTTSNPPGQQQLILTTNQVTIHHRENAPVLPNSQRQRIQRRNTNQSVTPPPPFPSFQTASSPICRTSPIPSTP
jgi:hypothetical protein